MSSDDRLSLVVLVAGATGQQGGVVARKLIDHGHQVYALTRRPDSPKAQELTRLGIQLVKGSFTDTETLTRAARDVDTIFTMSTSFEAGPEAETNQGKAISEVVRKADVEHLVYNSVASADRGTGIAHFESKFLVEQHIKELGVPHTIIGPTFFIENHLFPPVLTSLKQGKFGLMMPGDRKLQQVALEDIGSFAVHVIENRVDHLGKRIDIASDDPTGFEMAEVFSRSLRQEIEYVEYPIDPNGPMGEEYASMMKWLDDVGYNVNIPDLHKTYPAIGWRTIQRWAQDRDWTI